MIVKHKYDFDDRLRRQIAFRFDQQKGNGTRLATPDECRQWLDEYVLMGIEVIDKLLRLPGDDAEAEASESKPNTPEAEYCLGDMLTTTEATRFLSVGHTFLYKRMRDGTIPWQQVGKIRLIPRAALQKYLAQQVGA